MRRSKFNLSNYKLLTGNLGQLIPCGLVETLPGDTFQISTSALIRMSPLAAPVMHPVSVRIHHFFVPHRLIWSDAGGTGTFEDFITSGPDGNDAQTVPTMPSTGVAGDLLDYYGIPPVAGVDVSALPVTGFNAIFNEYYRDQDLVSERAPQEKTIPLVAWEKDYLTAARPWPQKGPDITLPVAGQAPVGTDADFNDALTVKSSTQGGGDYYMGSAGAQLQLSNSSAPNDSQSLYADLTQAQAVKVNEFRRAFALQRYAEARSRYGSRYTEYLRYLGVRPSDARLDRPEYLAGGRVKVQMSEVLQTAPEGSTPARDYGVGDMYGHGIAAMRTNRFRRFFEEHGYIHSFISVRPKAMYLQSIERHWLRNTRDEFWQKELQHIGQQEVYNNEVYADAASGTQTFGYQDRYREYRECKSTVAGEFRNVLNYWHLGRDFASAPALNASFVECDPSKRIFNEQTQNSLWIMCQHSTVARRKVSRIASNRIL